MGSSPPCIAALRLGIAPLITTDLQHTDLLRRAALENAIVSGEMEGFVYTPAMRNLLDRSSRGLVSEEAFDRAVRELAHSTE